MTNPKYTKHKVATDALETLGMLIPENSGRDAIHLAVEPAVCGPFMMPPGARALIEGGVVVPAFGDRVATGIVDPFLKSPVKMGDRFWFVVLPRTITSLRHVWSHPAFPEAPAEQYHADDKDDHYLPAFTDADAKNRMSRAALKDALAANEDLHGVTVDEMIEAAKNFLKHGEFYYGPANNKFTGGESLPAGFWDHYENITGERVAEDARDDFFTCSC